MHYIALLLRIFRIIYKISKKVFLFTPFYGMCGYRMFLCAFIASMSDFICGKSKEKNLPVAFIPSIHCIIGDKHRNKLVPKASTLSVEDITWAMHGYRHLLVASRASMSHIICAKRR